MPIIEKEEEEGGKGGTPYTGKSTPIGEEEASAPQKKKTQEHSEKRKVRRIKKEKAVHPAREEAQ